MSAVLVAEAVRMNPFQEVILDRLMGAQPLDFQQKWGPISLALQALVDARLIESVNSALDLGYPLMLSKALQAACAMLTAVDEQRQLAIAVFAEVSPGLPPAPLSAHRQILAALWCAQKVHPLICHARCPFLEDARKQIEHFCAGDAPAELPLAPANAIYFACQAPSWAIHDRVRDSAITLRTIGYNTITSALGAAQARRVGESPEESGSVSAAYAARLAAHFSGLPGVIEFCLELANELKRS